jgi:hypothetical protein
MSIKCRGLGRSSGTVAEAHSVGAVPASPTFPLVLTPARKRTIGEEPPRQGKALAGIASTFRFQFLGWVAAVESLNLLSLLPNW